MVVVLMFLWRKAIAWEQVDQLFLEVLPKAVEQGLFSAESQV